MQNIALFKRIVVDQLSSKGGDTDFTGRFVSFFLANLERLERSVPAQFSIVLPLLLASACAALYPFRGHYLDTEERLSFTEEQLSELKRLYELFRELQNNLWKDEFGVPTVNFFRDYSWLIEEGKASFFKSFTTSDLPELFNIIGVRRAPLPVLSNDGKFEGTSNRMGFSLFSDQSAYTGKFIEMAVRLSKQTGDRCRVLEVGSGTSDITTRIAKAVGDAGLILDINDLSPEHLAILEERITKEAVEHGTREKVRVNTIPGDALYEVVFPKESYDAVFSSRVVHFFSGDEFIVFLRKMYDALKSDGVLILTAETGRLANWAPFKEYVANRKASKEKWPGEIIGRKLKESLETAGFSKALPNVLHWIDKETLEDALKLVGFTVESVGYIDRSKDMPPQLVTGAGEESVGSAARKSFRR